MRKTNFYLTSQETVIWILEEEKTAQNTKNLMLIGEHEIYNELDLAARAAYYRKIYEGKSYYKQLYRG